MPTNVNIYTIHTRKKDTDYFDQHLRIIVIYWKITRLIYNTHSAYKLNENL